LPAHCVSRPLVHNSGRFLNGHRYLQPHCVSRRRPVKSAQRIGQTPPRAVRLLLPHQPPPQPVLPVVVRLTPPPGLAGSAVPLALAGRRATRPLAIPRTGVGCEPLATDPTWTLASHAALRQRKDSLPQRPAPGKWIPGSELNGDLQEQRWVSSREQGWVHSGERRRRACRAPSPATRQRARPAPGGS